MPDYEHGIAAFSLALREKSVAAQIPPYLLGVSVELPGASMLFDRIKSRLLGRESYAGP